MQSYSPHQMCIKVTRFFNEQLKILSEILNFFLMFPFSHNSLQQYRYDVLSMIHKIYLIIIENDFFVWNLRTAKQCQHVSMIQRQYG